MIPPPRPGTGTVLVPWLVRIWEFILSIQPRVGPGLQLVTTSSGTIISLAPRKDGTTAGTLDPWEPTFFTTGTAEAPVYKVRFNLGSLNQVPATNWNAEHTLSMAADTYHFAVLTVTTASGEVSGLTLSIDAAAPVADEIAKDVPPVSFKILLGAVGRSSGKMIITTNLQGLAAEVFRESKAAPAVGAEPFSRWWRWQLSAL